MSWLSASSATRRLVPWTALGVLALGLAAVTDARAATTFDGLIGNWAGSGQIRFQDGLSEGIRCNAYYTGGGQSLRLAIRCKSDSNEIEIRGQLTQRSDRVTGSWEERTFNASGEATGRASDGKMALTIAGGGFSGSMTVSYEGSQQTVQINSEGIALKSVNVTLRKG